MRKLFVILTLLASCLGHAQEQLSCNPSTFGGPDAFPWGLAQPFPWSVIEGVWKISEQGNVLVKFKVIRALPRQKKLNVSVYDSNNCTKPFMSGVGIINFTEPNVVRVKLKDELGEDRLMKIALFDPKALQIKNSQCGSSILAASLISLGSQTQYLEDDSKMMLTWVSSSLDIACKTIK